MASPNKETNHEQDVLHLFKAISKGKAHLTRFMLAASGPTLLNCFNEEGRTPLMECCYIREEATRVSMVKCIRDAGADVNVKDDLGRTALIHACMERCNDVVRILIMHCRIIPDTEDSDGNTALIHSASNGNDIAVELLVRNFRRLGLQVDHFNKEGYSALHVAARNGFLQCAKILATKGKATLTLKDKVSNMTPMEICLAEGYQKSEVEFLKPSVKFYKVAKLTTTMVKYRKRSSTGQDSIGSVASKIAPATATVEKEKKLLSKLNILKKSKPATTNNEAGTSSNSVPTVITTAPPPPAPTQQPATQKSPGDKDGPADQQQGNSKAKRLLPLLKDMAKRSGQQKYANCSEKKSEVIRLLEDGIKKDGTVQNKISPMTKRKTDGMIDMNKANRPQKLVTSNSTTSPFTEKDFPKSEFPDDGDDVTTCSTATDVTDLDGGDRQTTPPGMPSNNNNNSNATTTAAFKINNNNNNTTSSGLRQHHANNIDQCDHFSPDDQSEEFDFESISECSLPSMSSPTTQTASSSCNDDVTTSSNASSTPTPQPCPTTTTSKNRHSKNTGGVSVSSSTSPRTEIEYIALNDDQTNPSQTGSASSNDMTTTLSGSGNSDDSSVTCEDVRPNFDKLVTGHVLKAIDDDGETKDGKDFPNSTTQNCKTGSSTNSGSENHRKNVNGVNVVTKPSDENDNGQTTRADSASPATIIESLDGLSIPKDFSDRPSPKAADAGGHLGDGSIDILRYTNDSVDAKMRRVDVNESTTC